MLMPKIILLCLASWLFVCHVQAQDSYRTIGTVDVLSQYEQRNPDNPNPGLIEEYIIEFSKKPKISQTTIPVIIHIVHNGGSEEISESQVEDQINALNDHFAMKEIYDHPAMVKEGFGNLKPNKLEIDFCLGEIKINKKKSPAILYHASNVDKWTTESPPSLDASISAAALDPDKYLNIWICDLVDTLSGYAQMPGWDDATDGIVVDYQFFGVSGTDDKYSQGKTLTHLIGNYFGLYPLWGRGNCEDDFVSDTPIHNAPNYTCPGYKHMSTCDGNPIEMTMNFMDNTNDECMSMFTLGQMVRMHAVISKDGPRGNLSQGKSKCNNGKSLEDDYIELDIPIDELLSFSLVPNPVLDELNIQIKSFEEKTTNIRIFNHSGQVVQEEQFIAQAGRNNRSFDVGKLAAGVYIVQVKQGSHTFTEEFVKIQF